MSSSFKNDRLIKAIYHQPIDATPIWIMRQAGRYLPEYRATRAKAGSFMKLCQTPSLACEVTLQPLARFDLDAAIIFSDILTIPDAMGLGLHFIEGKGPVFENPIHTIKQIDALTLPDFGQLDYVYDAISLVKTELNNRIPLIGFCGSPWTIALYMLEGSSSKYFEKGQNLRQTSPESMHKLLNILAKAIAMHLLHQIKAGADVVMIFDTWGGLLDSFNYEIFSLRYIRQIIHDLKNELSADQGYNKKDVPVILFTKKGGTFIKEMAETGCQVVGLDWETSLHEARKIVGSKVALQGNLDPSSLVDDTGKLIEKVTSVLASYGKGSGHIFNLGHGITPNVDPYLVGELVDAVHELSKPYHVN